jgi:DNA-binding transcriptional ArsR family regulator
MTTDAGGLAAAADLLAHPSRAAMVLALLDGREWAAGDLARVAGVAPPTAAAHLTRLVGGGLLAEERRGRNRWLRLAGPEVAALVEHLSVHAPPPRARGLRDGTALAAMTRARTCYDHLAGRLGVAITDALTTQDDGFALTPAGAAWLQDHGIDLAALRQSRRPLLRPCLDLTERRPHLAGGVGAAILSTALDRNWLTRIGTQRAVALTATGEQVLKRLLR